MCRYMKMTQLEDILQALRDPYPEQIIELNEKSYSVLEKSGRNVQACRVIQFSRRKLNLDDSFADWKAYSIIIGMRSTIEDCNTTDE